MPTAEEYPGCRPTKHGGEWDWFPGDAAEGYSAPLDDIKAFFAGATSPADLADRQAAIAWKLKAAESGTLRIYIPETEFVDGSFYDVRQIESAPQLLELKWSASDFQDATVGQWRLYFVEPSTAPTAMLALRFAVKTDEDQQDDEIDIAERIRVQYRCS